MRQILKIVLPFVTVFGLWAQPRSEASDIVVLQEQGNYLRVTVFDSGPPNVVATEVGSGAELKIPAANIDYILLRNPVVRTINLKGGLQVVANYSHEDDLFIYLTNVSALDFTTEEPASREVDTKLIEGLKSTASSVEIKERSVLKFRVAKSDILEVAQSDQYGFNVGLFSYFDISANNTTLNDSVGFSLRFRPRAGKSHGTIPYWSWSLASRYVRFSNKSETGSLTLISLPAYAIFGYNLGKNLNLELMLGAGAGFTSAELTKGGTTITQGDVTPLAEVLLNSEYSLNENNSMQFFMGYQILFQESSVTDKQGILLGAAFYYYL